MINGPIIHAVAMSIYIFNIDAGTRAKQLFDHFGGACPEMDDLIKLVDHHSWATEMPYPTACAYLEHAMARYGAQARMHVEAEESMGLGQ